MIQVGAGQLLTVDSAVLSENVSGAVVSTGLLTEAKPQHDPSNLFAGDPTAKFAVNQAVILPLAPLKANTVYRVQVNGKRRVSASSSPAVNVDFTFSTGAANSQ